MYTNPQLRMEVEVEAKGLVATYIEEVWNCGNLVALSDLTAPGFTYHLGGQPPRDLAGME